MEAGSYGENSFKLNHLGNKYTIYEVVVHDTQLDKRRRAPAGIYSDALLHYI